MNKNKEAGTLFVPATVETNKIIIAKTEFEDVVALCDLFRVDHFFGITPQNRKQSTEEKIIEVVFGQKARVVHRDDYAISLEINSNDPWYHPVYNGYVIFAYTEDKEALKIGVFRPTTNKIIPIGMSAFPIN